VSSFLSSFFAGPGRSLTRTPLNFASGCKPNTTLQGHSIELELFFHHFSYRVRMSRRIQSLLICITAGLLLAAGSTVTPAAWVGPDEKKPRRPKFGSSLKRLKWDPIKQVMVEKVPSSKAEPAAQTDEPIRLETLLVVFDLLVVTRGTQQVVTGLKKEDFTITEAGRTEQVATFALGDDVGRPKSIVLILDYSGSQAPYLQTSLEAARTLVNKLGPLDEMAILTDDVELLVDFTGDKRKLEATLEKIRKRVFDKQDHGKSLQFTTLFAALRELIDNNSAKRPIIIFQTDGDEATAFRDQPDAARFAFLRGKKPAPEYGLSDIYSAAERSRATIYSVITNDRLVGIPDSEFRQRVTQLLTRRGVVLPDDELGEMGFLASVFSEVFRRGQLATVRVASLSGGWTAWLEKPAQAAQIYSQILSDINNRYIIGYYPTESVRDGKLHNVTIEVKGHPEYEVHGRSSYYAPY
jgi:VWFA-related protein